MPAPLRSSALGGLITCSMWYVNTLINRVSEILIKLKLRQLERAHGTIKKYNAERSFS